MKSIRFFLCSILVCATWSFCFAQQDANKEIKKPAKYENRKLKSEKTGEKKFTLPKHVIQNTVTHYNYYFNANNRLKEVIEQAKAGFKDNYSKLLPFYNYTLETTAQNKTELDSIIYKCTAGILLHDLRNDWIDNMYLLLGKTYLLRNDLDSAGMTFQYLNFAFAPKEQGGYDIPIGSSASNETGEFSISTNEKAKGRSIWTKLTGHKPSRNESFVWQIRNHIEKNELPEAAGIIEILRHDPKFPSRLRTELNEEVAYWFYKQQVYDSAAFYLSKALNEADNHQEEARWEYLIGQLYQLSNNKDEAINYYRRSIKHTNDPVMDVYARLNSIKINGGDDKNFIQKNIDELVNMAKKDKYENYRDIIYYAAATIELERNSPNAAQDFLLKSVKYTVNNPIQRGESFMLLGDLNYNRKEYPAASNFYDSTDESSLTLQADKDRLNFRKPPLKLIAASDITIDTEDSLQALAKLPADQREAILRKKVRQLRKSQGLKEDEQATGNPAIQQQARDLFADSKSADFYFYNATLKSRGFSEFRSRWGQRPNVDNWRRMVAVNSNLTVSNPDADPGKPSLTADAGVQELSYEGLLTKVPLTEDQLQASNKKVMDALYTEGKTFLEQLEDYPTAIDAFEELLRRFPGTEYKEEALFNLAYAYGKTGDKAKADMYKNQLSKASPDNKWVKLMNTPSSQKPGSGQNAATKKYEDIYNLFIEGKFDQAIAEKKAADSTYGNSFWTPQLLFIESIYYIKQQNDSTAIRVLTNLASLHSNSSMAPRAKTMIDVLKRRKEIESYLTNLNVTRNEDGTSIATTSNSTTNTIPPTVVTNAPKRDTIATVATNVNAPKKDTTAATTVKPEIVKAAPPVRKDTVATTLPVIKNKNFSFVPTDAHYVVLVLDKVDPVYATEARNALNRYNKEKFYNQNIQMSGLQLDDRFHLVLQGPFSDANAAVDYVDKTSPVTRSRILPWLTADKYSYIVISGANMELLKETKDMNAYRQLLQQAFPVNFNQQRVLSVTTFIALHSFFGGTSLA